MGISLPSSMPSTVAWVQMRSPGLMHDKCEAHHQAVELLHAEADDAAGAEGSHAGSAARGRQVGSRAKQASGRDEAALASGRAVPPWTLRQQVALRVCT